MKIHNIVKISIASVIISMTSACAPFKPSKDNRESNSALTTPADTDQMETGEMSQFQAYLNQVSPAGAELAAGKYTFFAPTNAAFSKLPKRVLRKLKNDPTTLKRILSNHIVKENIPSTELVKLDYVKSISDKNIPVTVKEEGVYVGKAKVVRADIKLTKGVFHLIDKVLIPKNFKTNASKNIVEVAKDAGIFTTLLKAADVAGLVETLMGENQLTVFAPTDEAFSKLPADQLQSLLDDPEALQKVLLYHVAEGAKKASEVVSLEGLEMVSGQVATIENGETVTISGAKIIKTDIAAKNGVIHIIDSVMIPPQDAMDIVSTGKAYGGLTKLLAAAEAAGLVDTLTNGGPFTIFAPSDQAFMDLGDETLNSLLADPEALEDILLYHVVPGTLEAADVLGEKNLKTIDGRYLRVSVSEGLAYVDDSEIIKTDILASNGVIHVIDKVMLPFESLLDVARASGNFTTLLAAVEVAGLEDALSGDSSLTLLAPTDEAFAQLPKDTLDSLLAKPEVLRNILTYHVVEGDVSLHKLAKMDPITALNGDALHLWFNFHVWAPYVNEGRIVDNDIKADNGRIHSIDAVLIP